MVLSLYRQAAFTYVDSLIQPAELIDIAILRRGFSYSGQHIHLINPRKGIHKPRQMNHVLSIMTLIPRSTTLARYDDQLRMLTDIRAGRNELYYSFMGQNPDAFENLALRRAFAKEIPLIYFLGIRPGQVLPIAPVFVVGWDRHTLEAQIEFGPKIRLGKGGSPSTIRCRRPISVEYEQRLYEVRMAISRQFFRDEVFASYNGRCALCGLPERRLLSAAAISPKIDHDSFIVTNGLLLCHNHHAAFNSGLIAIDSDYRLHSNHLDTKGHKTLEGLKKLHGKHIKLALRVSVGSEGGQ